MIGNAVPCSRQNKGCHQQVKIVISGFRSHLLQPGINCVHCIVVLLEHKSTCQTAISMPKGIEFLLWLLSCSGRYRSLPQKETRRTGFLQFISINRVDRDYRLHRHHDDSYHDHHLGYPDRDEYHHPLPYHPVWGAGLCGKDSFCHSG